MARPKSEDKRDIILAAAIRIIAVQGPSAPTAIIAKEASVANGTLFNYFPTKADLLNQIYRDLKIEMAAAAQNGLATETDLRRQVFHVWTHGLRWAAAFPGKRRVLAHLAVSDDITPESREIGHRTMAGIARLLDRSREGGPLRDTPLGFVLSLMSALGDATTDFMIGDPPNADRHCAMAFEALWRMIA